MGVEVRITIELGIYEWGSCVKGGVFDLGDFAANGKLVDGRVYGSFEAIKSVNVLCERKRVGTVS